MIFGEFPLEVEKFAAEFIACAEKRGEELEKDSRHIGRCRHAWTEAVKDTLRDMASKMHGYTTLCTSFGHDTSEFLLDAVWWERAATGGSADLACESVLESAVLACESEFDQSPIEIGKDF